MTNEDNNVKTVKDAYTAYQDGNMRALLAHLSEDVQWFEVGPRNVIPTAGARKGRKQVEEFFDMLEANEEVESLQTTTFHHAGEHGSGPR